MQVTPLVNHHTLHIPEWVLESGERLQDVTLAYTVLGAPKGEVTWVFHALSGNSNPLDWWPGLFLPESPIYWEKRPVVCVNVPGSCYGSTPLPLKVSISDMVDACDQVRQALEIEHISLGIGGSLGGQQLLTWASKNPTLFDRIVPIATNAQHSAWGIAFNEVQRMALELDPDRGIEVARAIALLSYKGYGYFDRHQAGTWEDQLFRAQTYMRYQGEKFRRRFTLESYLLLSEAMDRHSLSLAQLKNIEAKALVIGISSDLLFPVAEQKYLASTLPHAVLEIIDSEDGHDGFLTETATVVSLIENWLHVS